MTGNRSIVEILQETRKVLSFQRSLGIKTYPTTAAIQSFLADTSMPTATDTGNVVTSPVTPPQLRKQEPLPAAFTSNDANLEEIRLDMGDCKRCGLKSRNPEIIFGTGAAKADLFIVGEWPDSDEEKAGKPFQGANGELLDRMLQAIGMTREQVYLTNIVKCRPDQDHAPDEKTLKTCRSFLVRQIAVVNPKVILAMGPVATRTLLKNKNPLSRLRGRFHTFHGINLMPTFHPAFLIANPAMKKATWLDLQMVRKRCAGGTR